MLMKLMTFAVAASARPPIPARIAAMALVLAIFWSAPSAVAQLAGVQAPACVSDWNEATALGPGMRTTPLAYDQGRDRVVLFGCLSTGVDSAPS
ncbi:MAG: hypothetical protein DRQ55_05755 [Planctomycetota bacterium]|nr:MAG: hypothetical protein DRQ55_05755 [Planctomycetota bacterium]